MNRTLNVGPCLSVLDLPDSQSFQAVTGGNDVVRSRIEANRSYVILRYFRFVAHVIQSTLATAIEHIVNLRAEEQMIRVYARWRVAAMQHVQAIWNRAVGQYPRQPVRIHISTSVPTWNALVCEATVAFIVALRLPDPARLSFLYLRPETLSERKLRCSHDVIASSDLGVVRGAVGQPSFRASLILPHKKRNGVVDGA